MASFSVLDLHSEELASPNDVPVATHARVRMFLDSGDVVDETFTLPHVPTLDELVAKQASQRITELSDGVSAADSDVVSEDHNPGSPGTVKNTPALALAAEQAIEATNE